jgi:hypothetical protein
MKYYLTEAGRRFFKRTGAIHARKASERLKRRVLHQGGGTESASVKAHKTGDIAHAKVLARESDPKRHHHTEYKKP